METKIIFDLNNFEKQKKGQWCFAAMIQMLNKHYSQPNMTQQQIVENIIRKTDKEGKYSSSNKNNTYDSTEDNIPQDPFGYITEKNMINYSRSDEVPDWTLIKQEIDGRRPIIVRVGASAGHYVLLVGYSYPAGGITRRNTDQIKLYYIDPNNNSRAYTEQSKNGIKNPNEVVNVEYTEKGTNAVKRADDDITGFVTTKPPRCEGGSKSRKSRSTRKKIGGKWSLKYKRSINCKRPRGFSQKQHCKYGRKK